MFYPKARFYQNVWRNLSTSIDTSKMVFEKVLILQLFCSNKFDTSESEFEQISILQKVSSFTALVLLYY